MRPSAPEALRPLRTVALHRVASVTLARREIVLTNLYSSKSYIQFVYTHVCTRTLYTKGAAPFGVWRQNPPTSSRISPVAQTDFNKSILAYTCVRRLKSNRGNGQTPYLRREIWRITESVSKVRWKAPKLYELFCVISV